MVRDCPTIISRGREANQVTPNAPDVGAQKMNHFYVPLAKETSGEDACNL